MNLPDGVLFDRFHVQVFRTQLFLIADDEVQHGEQQPCDEERGDKRKLHRVGQLLEKAACQPAHQPEREVDDNRRKRRCHHGGKKITDGMAYDSEAVYAGTFFVLPVNLFDNDNGIIDNQSHRSSHRTERHDIDGNFCQIAEQDAESHRNGNGQHYHQTRPPRAKEQHHHDDGQKQSLIDGFQYTVDAVSYESTLIVIRLQFIACRKLLPYLVRLAFHLLREINQIHARLLHQIDKHGIVAVGIDFQKLLLFLYHVLPVQQLLRQNRLLSEVLLSDVQLLFQA